MKQAPTSPEELQERITSNELVLLIACSKRKKSRTAIPANHPKPLLPPRTAKAIAAYRASTLPKARLQGEPVPACLLYNGSFYRKASLEAWLRARNTYIISAAYGLLHPWELAKKYDIALQSVAKPLKELLRRAIKLLLEELGAREAVVVGLGAYRSLLQGLGNAYALEVLVEGEPARGVAGTRYYALCGEAFDSIMTGERIPYKLSLQPL